MMQIFSLSRFSPERPTAVSPEFVSVAVIEPFSYGKKTSGSVVIFVTVTTDTPLVEVTELVLLAELLELILLVVELVLSSAATRAVASISTSMIQLKIPTIFFMIPPFLLPDNPPLSEKADIRPGFPS
jgi:hypothetical protein